MDIFTYPGSLRHEKVGRIGIGVADYEFQKKIRQFPDRFPGNGKFMRKKHVPGHELSSSPRTWQTLILWCFLMFLNASSVLSGEKRLTNNFDAHFLTLNIVIFSNSENRPFSKSAILEMRASGSSFFSDVTRSEFYLKSLQNLLAQNFTVSLI